ncbi:isochorismatase family protein [Paenibacillus apiarius]|uniref:isochorismatase n=1 Tax=Paenibacillus apiarius TaxID=46240 RepID=A0ABT4E1V4_9BACL|nr:isochorismatase family protein [Paenibacillus apiarius]MCY9517540.1 isochorismatase family protein [Paenibacillus apiarius]MCY9522181.1 isochorismatase family protein [Paenibacillus apiarius]MCY9552215.1 isochorismatase family protein [Paenibacillus apiarius]MCY9560094.1 isochorismatase family protein [Paenibacillus apiarius]MCY9683712.1 isochorismatase family protein [Paenibacillus apiarius]
MALPSILPYPMPVESELPVNKVAWTPDPRRAVLLIHDMQQYFLDAFDVKESPVTELLANIRKLRVHCADLGIPVVYSAQPGGQTAEERGLLQDFWGSGIDDGPYQKKFVDEVAPCEHDIVMTKWRYSAFQKTNLLDMLRQRGRDQLMVCGIYAHIGCLLTSCEAFMQEVQPFFIADAVADFSEEKHRMALTYAAERCAVTITTQRLVAELSHSQAAAPASEMEDASQAESEAGSWPLTQQSVREEVAELLQEQPSKIADNDNLIMLWGLDSIRIMSLVERWRRIGVAVSFVELAEQPTLADWWKLLSSRLSKTLPNYDYFTV